MKILLFFLLITLSSSLFAQDTIRSLVITEARLDFDNVGYIEITNMGESPIQLNQFEFGKNSPLDHAAYQPPKGSYFILPNKILQPGECFLICAARDYSPEQFARGIEDEKERTNRPELLTAADLVIHIQESDPLEKTDSVSPNIWETFDFKMINFGQLCYYIEQHLPNGDSVIIDQVNGPRFTTNVEGQWSVAGVPLATGTCILARKFIVKTGNLNFFDARGIGEDDSEWIVIPIQGKEWRKPHWTIGNHLDAKIDKKTLESEFADVDFENKTITVPWGTRRADDIIKYFVEKPGIAWNYHLNNIPEDSLSCAAKTGDKLEIFACGNKVERKSFSIIVSEPSANANILIPVNNPDPEGKWRWNLQDGIINWPRVTHHKTGYDTIWGFQGGIPYATRTDSLLERLEKASLAKWEFVWVDGIERPDLKDGDKLKVTAENGTIKEYYISVLNYISNHDAFLNSITWPDIPDLNRGMFGWKEDTIPNFNLSKFEYELKVPHDYNRIPALVAQTNDLNASIKITKAKNLVGKIEDRTIKFTVTAEDNITQKVYSVAIVKEKAPEDIQPFFAEPFLSELVFQDQWYNGWIEIYNPGNQPLDLSNYMFSFVEGDIAKGITWFSEETDWGLRYNKYIPGYKWIDQDTWAVNPGRVVRDLNVNPMVIGGDVFVAGQVNFSYLGPSWWATDESDIIFDTKHNPWGEEYNNWGSAAHQWLNRNWYLYKILNDSIKLGLKPANDPNDFELVETFGHEDNSDWNIGGKIPQQLSSIIRKPHVSKGKKGYAESFGTDSINSEWIVTGLEERKKELPGEFWYFGQTLDLGVHMMDEITHYMSTISSEFYKVSEGYSLNEKIRGVTTGTTVAGFLQKIIKSDEGQTLKVISLTDGAELTQDVMLTLNDTLVVLSADSTNTTKYVLDVSAEGLSSNVLLTSARYEIYIITDPKNMSAEGIGTGTVRGFEYGTSLRTILANITVPEGAALSVINEQGAYVPTVRLGFNSNYNNVTVNNNIYIDVIAENGITEMLYQLIPDGTENDAFLLSDVYSVSQKNLLIEFVPRGTNVVSFVGNLFPSFGATVTVLNKMNQERVDGKIADDDKVVVTSSNGKNSQVYYISMLAEKYIPKTTYLAYILSDVYLIDQVEYKINGASAETSIADFYAKIKPTIGATAILVDKDGIEKTSGNITGTDMVKVTSLDGKTAVTYTFGQVTSTPTINDESIELYPNPTNGKLYISGVKAGNQIEIFNSSGALIHSVKVQNNIEIISLVKKPAGIYIVHISDKHKILGSYKIVKN